MERSREEDNANARRRRKRRASKARLLLPDMGTTSATSGFSPCRAHFVVTLFALLCVLPVAASAADDVAPRRMQSVGEVSPCPNPAWSLSAGSKITRLNYFHTEAGYYASDANCQWLLQCGADKHPGSDGGMVLLLNITRFDTELERDFLTIRDGTSPELPAVGPVLTGHGLEALSEIAFGALSGSMLVTFTSDPSTEYPGFMADYWCASNDEVTIGCTDPAAANYLPTASFRGHCTYDVDEQTALMLAAFPGHDGWGVSGWTAATPDPCAPGNLWQGLRCSAEGRVLEVDLGNVRSVRGGGFGEELGELTGFENLHLHSTGLSGTLPQSLGNLQQLSRMELYETKISGTLPSGMGNLQKLVYVMLGSTRISGTLMDVGGMTRLRELQLQDLHLSGTLPSFYGCTSLVSLDVTHNSLTGLPQALPPSLSHILLGRNPLQGGTEDLRVMLSPVEHLEAFDVSLLNLDLSIGNDWRHDWTEVVLPQTQCRVGTREETSPCSFTLRLYDTSRQPAHTSGSLSDVALGYDTGNGIQKVAMVNNRDGTFTGTVNQSWIQHEGDHTFMFFLGDQTVEPQWNAMGDRVEDWSTENGASLRTVYFEPRRCPVRMQPDPTGAYCLCEPDFTLDVTGNSCHRRCGVGTTVTPDGEDCMCTAHSYNISLTGALLCVASDEEDPTTLSEFQQIKRQQQNGEECRRCPAECAICANGVATLLDGWRLTGESDEAILAQIAGANATTLQLAFLCPYGGANCPSLRLDHRLNHTSTDVSCATNHKGILCAECKEGYSRKGSSDNRCITCDASEVAGMSVVAFRIILVVLLLMLGAAAWTVRVHLERLQARIAANTRILVGAGQVISLLPAVLDLVYPVHVQSGVKVVSVLVINVNSMISFDCHGIPWNTKWLVIVFALPLLAVFLVTVHWARIRYCTDSARNTWQSDTHKVDARNEAYAGLAMMAMLLYPQLSTNILGMLNCRQLGPHLSVLESAYGVHCNENEQYQWYRAGAAVMLIVWVLGVPLVVLAWLVHQYRESQALWAAADTVSAQRSAAGNGQLQEEMEKMKVSELKRKAKEMGVTEQELEIADDEYDTKAAVIELTVARVSRTTVGGGIDNIHSLTVDTMDNPLVLGRGNSTSAITESLSAYHYSRVRKSFGFLMDGECATIDDPSPRVCDNQRI